jgi:hypothetical protein
VDFWTPENPSTTWPRPRYERHDYENLMQYVDGSYVRVRNITLGYRLPATMMRQMNLLSARVYVSAQNPFTFTEFEGYDPEGATGNHMPNYRTFLVGFDLTF